MTDHRNVGHAVALLNETRLVPVLVAAVALVNGLEAERAPLSAANRKRLENLRAAIEKAGEK